MSDGTDPRGLLRYNSELKDLEVYEGVVKGWVSQNSTENFAGHNLTTYSQDFTQSGWNKSGATITANNTRAPDGTLTASKLVESVGGDVHYMDLSRTYTTTGIHTYSIYVKAAERSFVMMRFYADNSVFTSGTVWFNLSTGVVGFTSASITASIINVGGGWYRLVMTTTVNAAALGYIGLYMSSSLGTDTSNPSYSGNGSNGVFVWGAQLEQATTHSPYTLTAGVASPIPTTIGGYRVHTYTATGTSGFTPACTGTVDVLVVAGGGGGGGDRAGGGGGGGVVYRASYPVISGRSYPVTVGAGGAGSISDIVKGSSGGNSTFGFITAIGGGGGGSETGVGINGLPGGSGGGGTYTDNAGGGGGIISCSFRAGGSGGRGAVRIVWAGGARGTPSFPSTNVGA
jgi:hypothetical protein